MIKKRKQAIALRKPPGKNPKEVVVIRSKEQLEVYKNTFDIHSMNLEQLAIDLKTSLDKKQPTSIFFKGRQNRKIELDNERKSLLLDGIENLRTNNVGMLQLQADAFLTAETLQHIVNMKRLEFQISFEKTILDMSVYKKEIDYKIKQLDTQHDRDREALLSDMLSNEARRKTLISMDIANNSAMIDNESKIIQNRMNRAKAALMEKFEKDIDFESLPKALQVYAISELFGNTGAEYGAFEREQTRLKYLDDEFSQELRKKTYEADSLKSKSKSDKSQADVHRASADVSIQDLESELDEED